MGSGKSIFFGSQLVIYGGAALITGGKLEMNGETLRES
jgi:hypothetical protein